MIKTKQGEVFASGSVEELLVDLIVIARGLRDSFINNGVPEKVADKQIRQTVEIALSSIGCWENPADTCHKDADPVGEAVDRLFEALFHGCAREGK